MVRKIFVEKKKGISAEADNLKKDIFESLAIELDKIRILTRYDVENISAELFDVAVKTVFSEPPVDDVYINLPPYEKAFQVSYLPGQFDQRSTSAEECISFISPQSKVKVKSSRVYLLYGELGNEELKRIESYLINPVEAFLDSLDDVETLSEEYEEGEDVGILEGFIGRDDEELGTIREEYSLAMDEDDLRCIKTYFKGMDRDPTITELRVLDTYWSDHCRHTTFLTELKNIEFHDDEVKESYSRYLSLRREVNDCKPVSLMDIATLGAKVLKKRGALPELDESEEINACSINVDADIDGKHVPYLLMFKNETHNHPTEIEPFGGAATCIGGAIRDPLSGRSYVYQAARITGSGDILKSYKDKMEGKLSQKKIGITSASGYSSYGNQIGLATGIVDEIYHPGYEAKHMELGAVVAAARKDNVVRLCPEPGDIVILLGGRTGRDGIGGATGSSKSHEKKSVEKCSSEVQKGNAPEERKLQRLFRNPECARMIKRCNDFGAGGVAVAIGELAPGLVIDLDKVKKKYMGLDGTEIAISESQERMAVVIDKGDEEKFLSLAKEENLEATTVATVTSDDKLIMLWRGKKIVELDRSFLDTNGAKKETCVCVEGKKDIKKEEQSLKARLSTLKHCSREGLSERFDSTIGASTLLMPFGGRYQKTSPSAMAALLPTDEGEMNTASIFSYAYDPYLSTSDPYNGAKNAVFESIAKIIATGGMRKGTYLTFQEYFGKPGRSKEKWGRPLSSLLGALDAQMEAECAAIGGKDSMSGTFEDIDVPNTLVSFAINTVPKDKVKSPELKKSGSYVYLLEKKEDEKIAQFFDRAGRIIGKKCILSASTVPYGDIDVTLAKLSFGNMIGLSLYSGHKEKTDSYSFLLEADEEIDDAVLLGRTVSAPYFARESLSDLLSSYEGTLESIYPMKDGKEEEIIPTLVYDKRPIREFSITKNARPRVLIPTFPGTNCEYDSKRAFERAGGDAEIFIVNNLDEEALRGSIQTFTRKLKEANILFIPGGFSGADEPDGSGKFITAFLRNPRIMNEIETLLSTRDGLVGGICNGFQALIKLGLITEGRFSELKEDSPTLTFNTIGRHQSRLVRTRIVNASSPWLMHYETGDIESVPVSHGEGRILMEKRQAEELFKRGQIASQYVDLNGYATMDIAYNVNGSVYAIEGLTSPDGKVFGRMGHIERAKPDLYKNVVSYDGLRFFQGAIDYFS